MNEGTTIFIDTQDMEERYGEELYKEYLEKENKQLKEVIEEVRGVAQELKLHYQQHPTMIPDVKLNKLLQILDKATKEG